MRSFGSGFGFGFGFGISGGGGGSGGNLALMGVAMNTRGASSANTLSGGRDTITFRYPVYFGADAYSYVPSFYAYNVGGTEGGLGNNVQIIEWALEDNVSQTVVGSFDGGATPGKLILDNTSDIQGDPILPSSFGLSKFAKGTLFWAKGKASVPANGKVPCGNKGTTYTGSTGSQATAFVAASTTPSAITTYGQYTFSGTAPANVGFVVNPIALGLMDADTPSFITHGDSIADNALDNEYTLFGLAFIDKACANYGVDPYPVMNFARTATESILARSGTHFRKYMKYANTAIDEYLTNDLNNGASLATLQARAQELWGLYKANLSGAKNIIRTELMARTSSTDNWATNANQTVLTDWGPGEKADLFNQWLPSQVTAGNIDAIASMADVLDADGSRKWATDGTTAFLTAGDDLHPSTYGHKVAAASTRKAINALYPITSPYPATGQLLRFDASDPTVITGLQTASALADKSTFGRNVSQATSSKRPVYQRQNNALVWDGTDDVMSNSSPFMYTNGRITIYAVLSAPAVFSKKLLAEGGPTGLYTPSQNKEGGSGYEDADVFIATSAGFPFIPNTGIGVNFYNGVKKIIRFTDTGAQIRGAVNGIAGSNPKNYTRSGTVNFNAFFIGAQDASGGFMNLTLHEMLIYDDDSQAAQIEAALALKWKAVLP